MIGVKPLRIRFNKVDGFIRTYDDDGTRYLILFVSEKYDATCDKIRCLVSQYMTLYMFFLIILQKSKLIHMIFCL